MLASTAFTDDDRTSNAVGLGLVDRIDQILPSLAVVRAAHANPTFSAAGSRAGDDELRLGIRERE